MESHAGSRTPTVKHWERKNAWNAKVGTIRKESTVTKKQQTAIYLGTKEQNAFSV